MALLLLALGCGKGGPNQSAISGEVKLDGRPLEQGSIVFTPVDGTKGIVTGGRIENGRYRLTGKAGPTIGRNRVEIHAVRKTGRPATKTGNPLEQGDDEYEEAVAPRFNAESTLKFEVKPGENTADFTVESK